MTWVVLALYAASLAFLCVVISAVVSWFFDFVKEVWRKAF